MFTVLGATVSYEQIRSTTNRAATSKRYAEQVTCPHCSKTGSRGGMQRWHFGNCKNNPDSVIGNK